ncbi:endonuclease III [Clostridia bacterium]|nr:endonuclease III [Clostridia bacterium]
MNKVKEICELLDKNYPIEKCFLDYEKPHELLVATILSAQCTDKRVNEITKTLFKKYRSVEDFASAKSSELEDFIHSAGVYKNKAKNIISCCTRLIEGYGGVVPSDMEELTTLAGVGRKTANVIRCHIFNIPSVIVDTHVKRVSRRLGLCVSENPDKIEFELMAVLPEKHWIRWNAQIIKHGRAICKSQKPLCENCFLKNLCEYA